MESAALRPLNNRGSANRECQRSATWAARAVLPMLALALVSLSVCCRRHNPQAALDHAEETFRRGNLAAATDEAEKDYKEFQGSSWAWQFVILRAKILSWRGMKARALEVLAAEGPSPQSGELAVNKLTIEASAYSSLHRFPEAERTLTEAERICGTSVFRACGDVPRARGLLQMARVHYAQAEPFFKLALADARANHDVFAEATALLNLSFCADEREHFDEALDWAREARQISLFGDFADLSQTALGNMAWAYYKLGDLEKAGELFDQATAQARGLSDAVGELGWLTAAGYVYIDSRDFKVAEQAFKNSLNLAKQINSRDDIINSLIALAFVSEQTEKLDDAKDYADEALSMARADGNGRDIVYPLLVQGRIAARQHDASTAENLFRQVADSSDAPDFLKWEAQRSLAHLYEDEKQGDAAAREYRTALSTFEAARSELRSEHSNLTFLSNATRIYDDYIHLLISQGKTNEALRAADYDRARTLREGLGLVQKGGSFAPEPLNAQAIARHAGGIILFYWLGEKQSYVWVITPQATRLVPLNAAAKEIDTAVRGYRAKLEGPPEILQASSDGSTLYKMLIGPAQDFLAASLHNQEAQAKNNQIFIIPDGSLNSLNFETLMPASQHYWIEDVTVTSAGSLHLLASARPAPKQLAGKLLLMGDTTAPAKGDDEYARLPFAAQEVKVVAGHFEGMQRRELTGDQATPSAYLNGHPEQYSYIHFVAHGEASRPSPLDSAIILSRDPASNAAAGEDNSFKLYARDIVQHPLHADLVTISACYGSGKRSYSGEGLVGLSWAFLRAGAHNVVGALWDVSSISSAQLMDDFYGELQKGKSPSAALRVAKLKLLHSSNTAFHSPFYWAPFQLYTGASRAFPLQSAENNMR